MREFSKVAVHRPRLYRPADRGPDRQPRHQGGRRRHQRRVVRTVASGAIHIAEPDLEGLVAEGRLERRPDGANEPEPADVFMIAVPTPIDDENRPDLGCVDGRGATASRLLVRRATSSSWNRPARSARPRRSRPDSRAAP